MERYVGCFSEGSQVNLDGEEVSKEEILLVIEDRVKNTGRMTGWKADVNMVRAVLFLIESLLNAEGGRWLQRDVVSRRRLDSLLCAIEQGVSLNMVLGDGRITVGRFLEQKKFLLRRWDEQDLRLEGYLEIGSDDGECC